MFKKPKITYGKQVAEAGRDSFELILSQVT